MLRTSSYTIYVDLQDDSETMLLVHGYAGTYDRVSRRVATYVRSMEARTAPKPLYGEWSAEPAIEGAAPTPSDEALHLSRPAGAAIGTPALHASEPSSASRGFTRAVARAGQ